jgi:DNA-directed RNA polymerase specialized sigma24 family protein
VAPAAETAAGGTAQRSAADRRQEIYTLADYGFPPAEIARRVGSPIGEVELILGLREKK